MTVGHRCARCGVEIPEDAVGGVDWFYIPEAGIPESDADLDDDGNQTYDPMEPRGQIICADCNS
jgi:hypothetical protein